MMVMNNTGKENGMDFSKKIDELSQTADKLAKEIQVLKSAGVGKDYVITIDRTPYIFLMKSNSCKHCYEQCLRWLVKENYQIHVMCETSNMENYFVTPTTTYTIINGGGKFAEMIKKKKTVHCGSSEYHFRFINNLTERDISDWSECSLNCNEDRFVYVSKNDRLFCFTLHTVYPQEIQEGEKRKFIDDFSTLLVSMEPYDDSD